MNFAIDTVNNDSNTTMYGQSRSTIPNTDGNHSHRKVSILPSKNRKQIPLPINTSINTKYENLGDSNDQTTHDNNEYSTAMCVIIGILTFILIIFGLDLCLPITKKNITIPIGVKLKEE